MHSDTHREHVCPHQKMQAVVGPNKSQMLSDTSDGNGRMSEVAEEYKMDDRKHLAVSIPEHVMRGVFNGELIRIYADLHTFRSQC